MVEVWQARGIERGKNMMCYVRTRFYHSYEYSKKPTPKFIRHRALALSRTTANVLQYAMATSMPYAIFLDSKQDPEGDDGQE
jgi:hypothetical protein